MRIRPGTIHDAAVLADLAARTFADTFERDNAAADMQAHLADAYGIAQQTAELTSPAVVTLLAEADDGLVAYAQLRRSAPPPCVQPADAIELHRFYVDRPAHGTGIAQRLMDAVRDAARAAGADTCGSASGSATRGRSLLREMRVRRRGQPRLPARHRSADRSRDGGARHRSVTFSSDRGRPSID